MDNVKDNQYFVRKIQDDLAFIIKHMREVDMGELAHPGIPWTAIYGLRNRIVHDYGNVDLGIIFDTLKNSIPELHQLIEQELE